MTSDVWHGSVETKAIVLETPVDECYMIIAVQGLRGVL